MWTYGVKQMMNETAIRMIMDNCTVMDTCTVYTVDNKCYIKFYNMEELLGPYETCRIMHGILIGVIEKQGELPIYYRKETYTDMWKCIGTKSRKSITDIVMISAIRYIEKYICEKSTNEINDALTIKHYGIAGFTFPAVTLSLRDTSIWGRQYKIATIMQNKSLWDIQNKCWELQLSDKRMGVLNHKTDSKLDYVIMQVDEKTSAYIDNGTRGEARIIDFGERSIVERMNKNTWVTADYDNIDRQLVKVVGGEVVEILRLKKNNDIVRLNGEDVLIDSENIGKLIFMNTYGKVITQGVPDIVVLDDSKDSCKCHIAKYLDLDEVDNTERFIIKRNKKMEYEGKKYTFLKLSKYILYGALE